MTLARRQRHFTLRRRTSPVRPRFTYTVSDGNGGSATGTVNVTVNPVNDDRSPMTTTTTTNEDTAPGHRQCGSPTTPTSKADALTVTAVTQGANGTVTFAAGTVTYHPERPTSTGATAFTYTVSDGNGGTPRRR